MARILTTLYLKIQFLNLQELKMATSKSTGNWLKIGEVARSLDIAVETIRMYEREGILIPGKTETGQRIFNDDDVHWLGCIRKLIKEKGLNIEGIRRMLALMPCWNLRPCSDQERTACPAYHGAVAPCWMIKSQIPESCRAEDCRSCSVYQSAIMCDNLKAVLYHIEEAQSSTYCSSGVAQYCRLPSDELE